MFNFIIAVLYRVGYSMLAKINAVFVVRLNLVFLRQLTHLVPTLNAAIRLVST